MQNTSDQDPNAADGGTDATGDGTEPARPARRRRRRTLIISLLVVVVVLPLMAAGSFMLVLNHEVGSIDKVPMTTDKNRPLPDQSGAMNILLLGSDKGQVAKGAKDTTIAEDAKGAWPAGKYRSDTIMVVHVDAAHDNVHVVSIPRDTFTTIYDGAGKAHGKQKINAAFSAYGPGGAVSTVEHLTGLRMEHLAIMDWEGFKDLSTAVGGVKVHVSDNVYDTENKVQWKEGDYNLKGEKALLYVRQRYGLLRGDFDRIARQQNFLRSLMRSILSGPSLRNPVTVLNTTKVLTRNLTTDDGWSTGEIRGLAWSLRHIRAHDVKFIMTPVAGTPTDPVYGSIVELKKDRTAELFTALRDDRGQDYVDKYPDDLLNGSKDVN